MCPRCYTGVSGGDSNRCTRLCRPLPNHSATPPLRSGSRRSVYATTHERRPRWPFIGADDGIRTRDPHLGKVVNSFVESLSVPADLRVRLEAIPSGPPNRSWMQVAQDQAVREPARNLGPGREPFGSADQFSRPPWRGSSAGSPHGGFARRPIREDHPSRSSRALRSPAGWTRSPTARERRSR